MFNGEFLWDAFLMLLCYAYLLLVILVSSRIDRIFHVSVKASRKFLHAMIGNLLFARAYVIIPFHPKETEKRARTMIYSGNTNYKLKKD